MSSRSSNKPPTRSSQRAQFRDLSPKLLARVFHQPAMIYFNMVADLQSIRECARRHNVAPSAVSRQIAQLEDALGLELFIRDKRSVRLSPAGEILRRHSQRLTLPLEDAASELAMLRGLQTGLVRIAAIESVCLSFLPPLIATFARKHPSIDIDVSVCSSAEVVSRLMEERADVGLGFLTKQSRQVEMTAWHNVRVGALMRPDHPLSKSRRLTLADCFAQPIAIAKKALTIREAIDVNMVDLENLGPSLVEVDSIRMLVELAEMGHHVSIMTPIGAHNEIAEGRLLFRVLEGANLPTHRFGVMTCPGRQLHLSPLAFYRLAQEHFSDLKLAVVRPSSSD